ncbi:hypothetical protein TNCV_812971 [Trichonephila clavipes]|nr:hypothetical protein TNCV_812971 [Trichonephila clavipes]
MNKLTDGMPHRLEDYIVALGRNFYEDERLGSPSTSINESRRHFGYRNGRDGWYPAQLKLKANHCPPFLIGADQ